MHPMADQQDPDHPFAGLDYAERERRPQTEQIGRLAHDIAEMTGIGGVASLVAATLWDQGRVTEACEYLTRLIEGRRAEAEARKLDRRGHRGQ